jgi:hypothetical protein
VTRPHSSGLLPTRKYVLGGKEAAGGERCATCGLRSGACTADPQDSNFLRACFRPSCTGRLRACIARTESWAPEPVLTARPKARAVTAQERVRKKRRLDLERTTEQSTLITRRSTVFSSRSKTKVSARQQRSRSGAAEEARPLEGNVVDRRALHGGGAAARYPRSARKKLSAKDSLK